MVALQTRPTISTMETAYRLGVQPKKVRDMLRNRELDGFSTGARLRVFADSVVAFLQRNATGASEVKS